MGYVEARRRAECEEADCPVMRYCRVYWGHQCIRQFGRKIPRFRGTGNPYRRAARELERPVQVEQVGTLGTVIWLAKDEEEPKLELADDGPVRHPIQRAYERVMGR